jgi:hypothetical protein
VTTVAALYVDERGVYPKMPDVDCWGLERDARLYDGPWPVVAHPPCAPWGSLAHFGYQAAYRDLAPRAVEQVQRWGGVLEHPEGSRLWRHCELPGPGEHSLFTPGFTVRVDQVSWGHVARKRTWLYCVGVCHRRVDATLRTGGTPTHWVKSGRRDGGGSGGCAPPGIKMCSAEQRRRTPPAFAEWLVSLARSVRS